MRALRLASGAAALGALSLLGSSSAFIRLTHNGQGLRFTAQPVPYVIHASGSDDLAANGSESAAIRLAFDTWAQGLARAPGGRSGVFAADLGEALFAAHALRRHVAARALGEGVVPEGALEGVAQAVRRAPTRPWRVHARWNRGRLEVGERGLDPPGSAEETSGPT